MAQAELHKFELPKLEMPAAFRDMAEKSITQAKDSYEKIKSAAEDATDMLEDTLATASKGASAYNLRLIEAARTNSNAAFDFAAELMAAKSASDIIEMSTAYARRQFDIATAQAKDLMALAHKVATDTTEPVKDSMSKVFSKAA